MEQEKHYKSLGWLSIIYAISCLAPFLFNINPVITSLLGIFMFSYIFINFKNLLNKKYNFHLVNKMICIAVLVQSFSILTFMIIPFIFSKSSNFALMLNYFFVFTLIFKGIIFIGIAIKLQCFSDYLYKLLTALNLIFILLGIQHIAGSLFPLSLNLIILTQKKGFADLFQSLMPIIEYLKASLPVLQFCLYIILGIIFVKSSKLQGV